MEKYEYVTDFVSTVIRRGQKLSDMIQEVLYTRADEGYRLFDIHYYLDDTSAQLIFERVIEK